MTTHVGLPETISALPAFAASRFAERPAQRFQSGGEWRDVTFAELNDIAREIAFGLVARGVGAGDRVAVLAETRAEWLQVEYGIATAAAVLVPIYPSSSVAEVEWVLADSGAVAVVVENATQLAKVEAVRDRLPALRHVVVLDDGGLAALRAGVGDPAELERRVAAVVPDEPAMIIYTSGTTGRAKGCVLTHRNMTACCRVSEILQVVRGDDVVYLFLPLAHVFAQITAIAATSCGAVVGYASGGAATIMADLQAVRPTFLPSVPRVFEKVYAVVAGLPPSEELYAKVRGIFGGRLRQAITGAAPIAPEILRFFHAAGVQVLEGYGLSESSGIGTMNTSDATRFGTIGKPVPECEIRIADDGEILMRGSNIFDGYWRNPEATAEALVDGWLQTGDLGSIDGDGYVSITGRKKDIIITAGGKNLSPNNLENDLRQSRWISQAVMHGDRRPYPVALVTLDVEQIVPWATERGLPAEVGVLSAHPDVLALVQGVLDEVNERYTKASQIKKFTILDHDLSVETGELTPTLKVKRKHVNEKYAALFDRLYAG